MIRPPGSGRRGHRMRRPTQIIVPPAGKGRRGPGQVAQCRASTVRGCGMKVDPLRLRQLGHEVQDEADGVDDLLTTAGSRLAVTGTAAGSWKAAGAATGATNAWRTRLGGEATRMRKTGKLFIRAAEEYMATDAHGASRIGQSRDFE